MDREIVLEFVTDLAIMGGLVALGVAAGVQLSLTAVQNTVMTTHALPLEVQAGNLYPVLVMMRDIVNYAGYTAAALLVGGAALVRRGMLSELLGGVGGGETNG